MSFSPVSSSSSLAYTPGLLTSQPPPPAPAVSNSGETDSAASSSSSSTSMHSSSSRSSASSSAAAASSLPPLSQGDEFHETKSGSQDGWSYVTYSQDSNDGQSPVSSQSSQSQPD